MLILFLQGVLSRYRRLAAVLSAPEILVSLFVLGAGARIRHLPINNV